MAIECGWHIQPHLVGFLVLIFGIIYAQHRFHPVSLLLVSHDGTRAYLHLFVVLKETYSEESGHALDLLFVIADGSTAIIAAMRMAFSRCPRVTC